MNFKLSEQQLARSCKTDDCTCNLLIKYKITKNCN